MFLTRELHSKEVFKRCKNAQSDYTISIAVNNNLTIKKKKTKKSRDKYLFIKIYILNVFMVILLWHFISIVSDISICRVIHFICSSFACYIFQPLFSAKTGTDPVVAHLRLFLATAFLGT